jgi:hypothetical protein
MHESVLAFCSRVITPGDVQGKSVLEVGSANVNGSVRPQIEAMGPATYTGVDLVEGPGVDMVCAAENLSDIYAADLVVSCEMLEHAQDWKAAFARMAALARETLVLTCRGPGFPYHNPPDYWRFVPSDLSLASLLCGLWPTYCSWDPQVPGVLLKAVRRDVRPLVRDMGANLFALPDVLVGPGPARGNRPGGIRR